MKRQEAQTIGEIITEYIRSENLETKLLEHRVLDIWPMIVGPLVTRATLHRRIENGVLSVRITSAPMRQELMMSRTTLMASLNKAVGGEAVREIRFV